MRDFRNVVLSLLAITALFPSRNGSAETTSTEAPPISAISKNLGVQVRRAMIMRSDLGKDKAGNDVLYTVTLGAPATLAAVDVQTGDLVTSMCLPNTSGAWGVKASPDGTVYVGAYNQGLLYHYLPKTGELKDLGHPFNTNDAVLYPMDCMPDGKVYGGTYPSGHAYEYDPATDKFRDLGDMTSTNGKRTMVRVTVADPEHRKLYFGIGNQPQLVEYDLATGVKRDLLPEKYRNITAVYDLNLAGGRLFCRKETHNAYEYFVLDASTGQDVQIKNADTGETSTTFINLSRGLSPVSPVANKMYYSGQDRSLYEYDLDTNTVKSLHANVESALTGYAWVKLKNPAWPGYTLTGTAGNKPRMYRYNLQTGKSQVLDMELPTEPVNIHDIERGPDGKLYMGGYLAGNMGVYNPATGQTEYHEGSGQPEGLVFIGNKLYMGIYPDAKIFEYDITQPWNMSGEGKKNPRWLFDLIYNADIPGYTNQDRPFGMAGAEDLHKLFIGTVPKNGMLGGVFAVYDVDTGAAPEIYWNLVPDQSIVSLAYRDGLVYGGTSVYGGMGVKPKATEAQLFIWDVAKKQKVFSAAPVKGAPAINVLYFGPDGNLWGIAGGTIFTFDLKSRKVIWSEDKFPGVGSRYRDASLLTGKDGNIYGTAGGKMFKLDPKTKALEVIATGANKMEQDLQGRFYIFGEPRSMLFQYPR